MGCRGFSFGLWVQSLGCRVLSSKLYVAADWLFGGVGGRSGGHGAPQTTLLILPGTS